MTLRHFASVRPSVRPSVCPSVCLSVRLSVRPSVCPSVCLSVRLSVRPSDCPSVCLSVRHCWMTARNNPTQREVYFTRFENLSSRAWHSGTLEAANATLGNLFEASLMSVLRFAKNESNFHFSREGADHILQYIRSELG